MQHILEPKQFDRKTLEEIFALADSLHGTRNTSLSGKILATLFYEPSTRTRLSFESAMLRLGGSVVTVENAKESSSATKGETIEDTIRMLNEYADVIVMRHPEAGSAAKAAAVSAVPFINGGDGGANHPTQGLLDLYTIQKERGSIDGVKVVFVGDLAHSRTIRSLAYLLSEFTNVSMTLVSPKELKMKSDIIDRLNEKKVAYTETTDLATSIKDADVVYMNRIQKERFEGGTTFKLDSSFVMTRALADTMKEGSIIMNPLPRVDELLPEVDTSPRAAYFRQVGYGVTIRMALLTKLLS